MLLLWNVSGPNPAWIRLIYQGSFHTGHVNLKVQLMAVLYQSDSSTRKSDIQCVLGYPNTSVKVSPKNALFESE